MLEFKSIFESHFFSNHHVQAQKLEASLEDRFLGNECVTFSSFPALVTAVVYEMCDEYTCLFNVSKNEGTRSTIDSLNRFLDITAHVHINEMPEKYLQNHVAIFSTTHSPDLLLVKACECKAAILDLSYLHPMLEGAGAFITNINSLAEKIRWARSSYGRRGAAVVNIAANGRLSEFQAELLNNLV